MYIVCLSISICTELVYDSSTRYSNGFLTILSLHLQLATRAANPTRTVSPRRSAAVAYVKTHASLETRVQGTPNVYRKTTELCVGAQTI